ncbi:hypothetical protein M3Y99_01330000 [Aphelenchoides fujianensis]|nr:hypothetical protein M3Y99_01330000 [Aphelenchoides fujianensis]
MKLLLFGLVIGGFLAIRAAHVDEQELPPAVRTPTDGQLDSIEIFSTTDTPDLHVEGMKSAEVQQFLRAMGEPMDEGMRPFGEEAPNSTEVDEKNATEPSTDHLPYEVVDSHEAARLFAVHLAPPLTHD